MRRIDPKNLDKNVFTAIGEQWMLITAGTPEKCNTMTASWGGLGVIWNAPAQQSPQYISRDNPSPDRTCPSHPVEWPPAPWPEQTACGTPGPIEISCFKPFDIRQPPNKIWWINISILILFTYSWYNWINTSRKGGGQVIMEENCDVKADKLLIVFLN